jgi:hypothetical protein
VCSVSRWEHSRIRLQWCTKSSAAGELCDIGVINAAKIVNMARDAELREAVLEPDVILARRRVGIS